MVAVDKRKGNKDPLNFSTEERNEALAIFLVKNYPSEEERAIFIAELSKDDTGKIEESTLDRIGLAIAKLPCPIPQERTDWAYDAIEELLRRPSDWEGGPDSVKRMLRTIFSVEGATVAIKRLTENLKQGGLGTRQDVFKSFERNRGKDILEWLQDENPQTIALILAFLHPAKKAAEILHGLPPKKQLEVVKRLAALESTGVSEETVAIIEKVGRAKTEGSEGDLLVGGGVLCIADIFKLIDRSTERAILEALEEENPDLVDQIRRLMFVFEDLVNVNNRGIQNVLKEIENEQLALALRNAKSELKEKFFNNMSKRAGEGIREEMEFMGPVRLADIEAAQQAIVDVARRLEEQGEIIVQGHGGEEEQIVI